MMDGVREGRFDAILSWHPDRLHRSTRELEDLIDVVNLIETTNCKIATCEAGDYDLATPSGRMAARVVCAVARHESEHKSRRIRRKHEQLAAKGMIPGRRRTFGYDRYVVVEDEADILRTMLQSVLAGKTMASIARDANSAGSRTLTLHNEDGSKKSGGFDWDARSARKVLLRPGIAGLRIHHGKIVGEAAWPAIVDRAEWEVAVKILTDPSRRTAFNNKRVWLLSGVAKCRCGKPVHAGGYKSYPGAKTSRGLYSCCYDRKAEWVDEYVAAAMIARLSRADAKKLLAQPTGDPKIQQRAIERVSASRARLKKLEVDHLTGDVEETDEAYAEARGC
jgi:site-specific DNA recombinase